jgi:hypothetical protein
MNALQMPPVALLEVGGAQTLVIPIAVIDFPTETVWEVAEIWRERPSEN